MTARPIAPFIPPLSPIAVGVGKGLTTSPDWGRGMLA